MKKITVDGNTGTAMSTYATNEVAIIYPITPSSPMAESCDEWASQGKTNIYGTKMKIVEMQSEGGAAGALHGSLLAGSLTTTFTASQGLLLMIPNMYKIAGELLPCLFNVSARTLATHALSIFGDHSDIYAVRQTGFAMLDSCNVQEAHDFATIAMMTTLKSRVPFLHFFDGFRTSHEIQKISVLEDEEYKKLISQKDIDAFKALKMTPNAPEQHGTAQNPDVFFQNREANEPFYRNVLTHLKDSIQKFYEVTGRNYLPYEYVGPKDATKVIVTMCSSADTLEEVTKDTNKKEKEKTGVLKVRLFRPFYASEFCKALPKSTQFISVLDKAKEPGSDGEPLYKDVVTALAEMGKSDIKVLGGRYGLGGKDFTPSDAYAVIKNNNKKGKNHFTVGINDDVSFSSLPFNDYQLNFDGTSCMFYGLGSDGTVSANKNSIKIIGDNTNLFAQGYFVYDSKKSGSITISHLRFGKKMIKAPYNINKADFVACHNPRYIGKYDLLSSVKDNGTFLLNCTWKGDELTRQLPAEFKQEIVARNINFYTIDAEEIAFGLGLKGKINTIMQSAFFKLANIIPFALGEKAMKDAAKKSYGKAGESVVNMNYKAIEEGSKNVVKIQATNEWANSVSEIPTDYTKNKNAFSQKIMQPIANLQGDTLPVSAFTPNGAIPADTTRFEKRGIAQQIPEWIPENCIQCNMCSTICPHGAIKAVLVDKGAPTPKGFVTIVARAIENKEYRIQISPLDCTGCGNCANICPAIKKALVMKDGAEQIKNQVKNFEFASKLENDKNSYKKDNIKGLQFAPCHFAYSGACAGCGETAYIKMATQLFGDSMLIANATGCSSIYGGSYPACPYTMDKDGHGPAWSNSLFEDNAEFGLGMRISLNAEQELLATLINNAINQNSTSTPELKEWLNQENDLDKSRDIANRLIEKLEAEQKTAKGELKQTIKAILSKQDSLNEKTVWIIGGDGWAYDIGYGGLDHVIASGQNVKILVLDSQVYSNTGGQASKATPLGAIAKFAESGKRTARKSLSMMALNYPNVYVAQVSLGANLNQTLQCMREAEEYDGPAIIVAYSPCINQGIDMSNTNLIQKQAVLSGHWHLFHYSPVTKKLTVDSNEPSMDYEEFAKTQRRFANLYKKEPEIASQLINIAKQNNMDLYNKLKKLEG